ncbi:MAG: DUF1987 domain-containing protein [Bacteroidetes bacterium]|nr:DUF1987 domain-containing protein [Bacteroidota bacterium]
MNIEPLVIEATSKTPKVVFDPDNNFYEFSGRSLPENVVRTYEPILKWIDANINEVPTPIEINFRMDYLNSASAKMVSLILSKFEEFYKQNNKILINWYYFFDDDDIQSEGEIYAMLKKVPIKLIGIKDED